MTKGSKVHIVGEGTVKHGDLTNATIIWWWAGSEHRSGREYVEVDYVNGYYSQGNTATSQGHASYPKRIEVKRKRDLQNIVESVWLSGYKEIDTFYIKE